MENLVSIPFRNISKVLGYADDLQLIVLDKQQGNACPETLLFIEQECQRLGFKVSPGKIKALAIFFKT